MSTEQIAISTLAVSEDDIQSWPLLPVETEIYILPDGRVVVADLPAELASLVAALGGTDDLSTLATPTLASPVCHMGLCADNE